MAEQYWSASSAGILPAVPRASRRRCGGRDAARQPPKRRGYKDARVYIERFFCI
jgi:hypothetical protein